MPHNLLRIARLPFRHSNIGVEGTSVPDPSDSAGDSNPLGLPLSFLEFAEFVHDGGIEPAHQHGVIVCSPPDELSCGPDQ